MTFTLTAISWVAITALLLTAAALVIALVPPRRAAPVPPDRLLARRLHHSRFGLMLHRHHVTEGRYLAHVPHDRALAQIDACIQCANAFHCDQVLACKAPAARADVAFCPNGETVLALSGGR